MSAETEALARRAVACAAWRWMPGMLDNFSGRVLDDCATGKHEPPYGIARGTVGDGRLPDLTDAATLGCLLALVREAWGVPDAFAVRFVHHAGLDWYVSGFACGLVPTRAASEAAALVAALEAAPVRR